MDSPTSPSLTAFARGTPGESTHFSRRYATSEARSQRRLQCCHDHVLNQRHWVTEDPKAMLTPGAGYDWFVPKRSDFRMGSYW